MPVEIADWNDLDNVRNDLSGDYVLVNDLDSGTDGYAGIGDDFNPIGAGGNGFTGQLNGGSFEINNLVIDKPNETFVGLFAQLGTETSVGGSVFDLTVTANVTGTGASFDEGTGVLAGTARGDTQITNVVVEGEVSQPNGDFGAGGLVGIARDEDTELKIESCSSHVDVIAGSSERVGGIVGYFFDDSGGLVITDSYATGSVEGNDQVGGLVGLNTDTVTDSYATGSVEGNDQVGGLVGSSSGGTEIDSYWDTETTGQSTSDGSGTGLTTVEMQGSEAETNMDGFDFENVWSTVEGNAETINGQITLDDVAVETATVILHNFSELESTEVQGDGYPILLSVDEDEQLESQDRVVRNIARTETDTDGNYSAEIPGAAGDTIAIAVDFDDGTERYGRVVTTVLE